MTAQTYIKNRGVKFSTGILRTDRKLYAVPIVETVHRQKETVRNKNEAQVEKNENEQQAGEDAKKQTRVLSGQKIGESYQVMKKNSCAQIMWNYANALQGMQKGASAQTKDRDLDMCRPINTGLLPLPP